MVIAGGGHNALVAATLLARAGRSVVVLERRDEVGGAAVSVAPFPGFDVRLSRYSYLVSLFPPALLRELGVSVEIRPRRVASHPPVELPAALRAMLSNVSGRVFPTLTEPLRSRDEFRRVRRRRRGLECAVRDADLGADRANVRRRSHPRHGPDRRVDRDVRAGRRPGPAAEPVLSCTTSSEGRWNVPVGGMGALSAALAGAARAAGADLVTRCRRDRDRDRRQDGRGDLCRRSHLRRAPRARGRRPGRARRTAGRAGRAPRGGAAQDQHAAEAPAARAGSQLGAGVHRHVPRQRGLRAAGSGLPRGVHGRRPVDASVRGLLPLADRPEHPFRGFARRRGSDAHAVRAAHAGATVRPGRRHRQGPRRRCHARLAQLGARRADRGLPAGPRGADAA